MRAVRSFALRSGVRAILLLPLLVFTIPAMALGFHLAVFLEEAAVFILEKLAALSVLPAMFDLNPVEKT